MVEKPDVEEDQAMYVAKSSGRNLVALPPDSESSASPVEHPTAEQTLVS
jgi:hypothetical protein